MVQIHSPRPFSSAEVPRCARDFACGLRRPQSGSSSDPFAPTTPKFLLRADFTGLIPPWKPDSFRLADYPGVWSGTYCYPSVLQRNRITATTPNNSVKISNTAMGASAQENPKPRQVMPSNPSIAHRVGMITVSF